jgi:hypothetical protein
VAPVQRPDSLASPEAAFAKLSKQKPHFALSGPVTSTSTSANKTTLLARWDSFAVAEKATVANLRVVSILKINVPLSDSLGFSTQLNIWG